MPAIEFIHFSDVHYQEEYSPVTRQLVELVGAELSDQFREKITYIRKQYPNAAFYVLTGDIVQDGNEREYRNFKRMWDEITDGATLFTIPGNHDNDLYDEFFPPCDTEFFHAEGGLRLLAMDSRGGQYDSGLLTGEQLAWLTDKLTSDNGRNTVLLLHHSPHVSGEIDYLTWQMDNPQELYKVVKDSELLAILCGHTHKVYMSRLGEIPVYTVDSITHDIDCDEEKMTFSNNSGFHHCVYNNGMLTVRHEAIRPERPFEIVKYYDEF